MTSPSYFADAVSSFDDASFVLFGLPYDKTSTFRKGAREAPLHIRQSSWNFETFNVNTGVDMATIPLHDYGDIDITEDEPESMIQKTKDIVTDFLRQQKFPLAIGGEHSITQGILSAYPKDISVISIDAHLDFRNQYENNPYNHACVMRRIADQIPPRNILVVGVRSIEQEELRDAQQQHLTYINAFDILRDGVNHYLDKITHYLPHQPIYLTLDIDVLDPAYAPGTSTPEPFGLTSLDVLKIIEHLAPRLIGFDLVEVCPPYDHGETALLAARYLRYVIEWVWNAMKGRD